jgi:hypothetical protein
MNTSVRCKAKFKRALLVEIAEAFLDIETFSEGVVEHTLHNVTPTITALTSRCDYVYYSVCSSWQCQLPQ